jgi:hypothetical protein
MKGIPLYKISQKQSDETQSSFFHTKGSLKCDDKKRG